ncbi:MAG: PAS domain S-box protein [Cyclobacteriaceae bacterium]
MDSGIDLLRLVFSSASEGIIISDEKGYIISANPMADSMFGYTTPGLEGLKIEDLVPTKSKKKHHSHRAEYFKKPSPRPMGIGMDLSGKRRDGSIFPIEISLSHFVQGQNRFVAAFVNDITERKKSEEKLQQYASHLKEMVKERTQELEHLNLGLKKEVMERRAAETALRKSQTLYEMIAKNFPGGTVSIIDHHFKVLFIEGRDTTEAERKALIGKSYISNIPDEYKDQILLHMNKCDEGEPLTWHYEKDSEAFIVHAVPILFEKKTPEQILIVEENITELKKAERETRKLLEQERELNEMKSRFVSMASHEFRTPLSTILSSANLISKYKESEEQDKRDKHLNRIKSSVKNLTEILNDFLSLERIDSGAMNLNYQSITLVSFLEETINELGSIKKADQSLNFKHTDLKEFIGDAKLLKNILINLVSNAIKYSPENGEIIVTANQLKNSLLIEIQDHGIGIPKKEQTHLFERFFRAKNAFNIQGTGLGLHIVKKYVSIMNGHIKLESEEGKGTTIQIDIPNGKKENISH